MPTQLIPDGFAQVQHVITLNGDPGQMLVTYGIQTGSEFITAIRAAAIHEAWTSTLGENMVDSYSTVFSRIRWSQLDEDQFIEAGSPSPGQLPGDGLPQNTAALIKKQTGRSGRAHRGRMFLPGVERGAVNELGVFSSPALGGLQTAAENFLDALTSSSTTGVEAMVVLHSDDASSTPAPTQVVRLRVDQVVATQRRRLRS